MLKRHGNILITSMLILKVFKVAPLYCHLVSDFLKSEICWLLIALTWNLILIGVHSRQLSKRYSLLECIGRQHSESTCQAPNALISISAWLPNLKDSSGSSYFIFLKNNQSIKISFLFKNETKLEWKMKVMLSIVQ